MGLRIVAICGIWNFSCYGPMWAHFRQAFKQVYPDSTFEVEQPWYHPWQGDKMRTYADSIVEKHDNGEDVLLVGYSMGGVIACAIAPRFKHSRVVGIVTVWAPHTTLFGLFSWMLGSDLRSLPVAPVLSFGARFDWFVLQGTHHPRTRRHVKVWSDHLLWLLFSQRAADTIAHETKRVVK